MSFRKQMMGDSLQVAIFQKVTIPVTLMITAGSLGIVIVVRQTHMDIVLLLFVIFEFSSAIGSICLISNFTSFKIISLISSTITLIFIIFATILGIYWIDNIILQNITYDLLYLRQTVLSFITIFTVSLLFKTLIILQIWSNFFYRNKTPRLTDIEASNSDLEAFSAETPSSISQSCKSTISKIKESVQILAHNLKKQNPSEEVPKNNCDVNCDLTKVRCLNNEQSITGSEIRESRRGTVDTSEIANSTPNMMFQNLTMPNLPIEESQILDTEYTQFFNPLPTIYNNLNNFSNHISEESLNDISKSSIIKHSNFEFPSKLPLGSPFVYSHKNRNFMVPSDSDNDDNEEENYYNDNNIQLLNISQPLTSYRFIEDTKRDARNIRNISPALWNKSRKNYNEENVIIDKGSWNSNSINLFNSNSETPKFTHDDFDIQTLSTTSSNYLINELKKEIQENGNHQVHVQQSLPNLNVDNKLGIKRSTGSFSKVLKNSLSTSNLNLNVANSKVKLSSRSLNLHHKKSISLSTVQTSKSKSTSPLKKFMNLNNLSVSTDINIPETPLTEQKQDFDLSLMNSIHHSPKKKSPHRSRNRNTTYSISKVHQNNISSNSDFELLNENESKLHMLLTKGKTLSSNNIQYINGIVDQIIVPNVMKTARVFSGTDKSTVSNNSVPSGYYGEYDKEKWKAFKKVNLNEPLPPNMGDVTHLSNFSISQA